MPQYVFMRISIIHYSSAKRLHYSLKILSNLMNIEKYKTKILSFDRIFVLICHQPKAYAENAHKKSPSKNSGFPPEYAFKYLFVFLIPYSNSSARPISLKNFDIAEFFGNGKKMSASTKPAAEFKSLISIRLILSISACLSDYTPRIHRHSRWIRR